MISPILVITPIVIILGIIGSFVPVMKDKKFSFSSPLFCILQIVLCSY